MHPFLQVTANRDFQLVLCSKASASTTAPATALQAFMSASRFMASRSFACTASSVSLNEYPSHFPADVQRRQAERAYVVWCPMAVTPRWRTPVYLVCFAAIIMYLGVVCHLFIGTSSRASLSFMRPLTMHTVRIAHLDDNRRCMIGFRLDGIIILVVYDV